MHMEMGKSYLASVCWNLEVHCPKNKISKAPSFLFYSSHLPNIIIILMFVFYF